MIDLRQRRPRTSTTESYGPLGAGRLQSQAVGKARPRQARDPKVPRLPVAEAAAAAGMVVGAGVAGIAGAAHPRQARDPKVPRLPAAAVAAGMVIGAPRSQVIGAARPKRARDPRVARATTRLETAAAARTVDGEQMTGMMVMGTGEEILHSTIEQEIYAVV